MRRDVTQQVAPPGAEQPVNAGRRSEAEQQPFEESSQLRLEKPTQVRLHLQRRAPANLRRHVQRAVTRFVVLVAADMMTFAVMRELIRAARDGAVFGVGLASWARTVLPAGYLNGWQFAVALFTGLVVTGNYGPGDQRRNAGRLFAASALATALPLWTALWTRGTGLVLEEFVLTAGIMWVAIVTERLTIDSITGWIRPPERDALDALFIGSGRACRTAMDSPAFAAGTEYRPIAFVDTQTPPAPGAVGHISDFSDLLAACGARVVVVCGYLSDGQFQEVVDTALAAGCQVLSVPRTVEIAGVHPMTVWRRGQPLVELTAPSLHGQQLLVKRLVDLIGASLALLLGLPVMLLAALAIKLDSGGPVFFEQERIGAGGRPFRVLKFRTMRDGVSDAAHRELVTQMLRGEEARAAQVGADGEPVFKLVNDGRITRVGSILRRTSLDELPQLFNVLQGKMSLVGPRPPLPYEFEQYEHWQFHRLQVRPGITGLWQVSGRNRLSYRQMCELDLEYVREWSLWLDLKILVKTIPVVVSNSGRAG